MELAADLLRLLPTPVLIISADGRVSHANHAALELIGRDPQGHALSELSTVPASEVQEYLRLCARTRQPLPGSLTIADGAGRPRRFRCDGAALVDGAILLRLRNASEPSQFVLLGQKIEELNVEVAKRRMIQEELEVSRAELSRVNQSLGRLQTFTGALSAAKTPEEIAEVVVQCGAETMSASAGALLLLSEGGAELSLVRHGGAPSELFDRIGDVLALDDPAPATDAVRGRVPVFVESPDEYARRYPALAGQANGTTPAAVAAAPLLLDGACLGCVVLGFPAPRTFRTEERELLGTLGRLCAQAMHRARLFAAEQAARIALEGARRRAEEASRVKDQFLAMLGHELRNPLSPIVTSLQMLKLKGITGREHEVIERQVAHLLRLVDDLLDVSRITRGKIELRRERVELATVAARAVEMASPLVERKRQALFVAVPSRGLIVDVDLTRMAQVIANLLMNASKYSGFDARIELRAQREGGRVRLAVRDRGSGIEPALLGRIFEPFVQAQQGSDRRQGGLGLGLAIVRSIVTLHGGTVRAHSEGPGRGSEFAIELPAVDLPISAAAAAASPPVRGPSPATGRRILVVDDNEDVVQSLADALEALGYETRVALDPVAALQIVQEFVPHVALLDIGLPVMDGYELAGHLRERLGAGRCRMAAITGYGQESDRARAREVGFDAHLVKPVDLSRLERLLREWTAEEERPRPA